MADTEPSFFAHAGAVSCLLVNEGVLYTASREVLSWNLAGSMECTQRMEGHTDTVSTMAMHEDLLVTGSADCTLRFWNHTGHLVQTMLAHQDAVTQVVTSSLLLYSASADGSIRSWTAPTAAGWELGSSGASRFHDVCMNTGFRTLALSRGALYAGNEDCNIYKVTASAGKVLQVFRGHSGRILDKVLTEDGCMVSSAADCTLRHWDCTSAECLSTIDLWCSVAHALTHQPGTQLVYLGCHDGALRALRFSRSGPAGPLSTVSRESFAVSSLLGLNSSVIAGRVDGSVSLLENSHLRTLSATHTPSYTYSTARPYSEPESSGRLSKVVFASHAPMLMMCAL